MQTSARTGSSSSEDSIPPSAASASWSQRERGATPPSLDQALGRAAGRTDGSALGPSDGKPHPERRALALVARQFDGAAVRVDDRVDDRQPQPGALDRAILRGRGAEEAV